MATNFKYVQNQETTIAGAGVSIGATSITLDSLTRIDGTVLAMTDFGIIGYGTLEPGDASEEQISWSGIVQNANGTATLTGVSTVLTVYPYTATSGLAQEHLGGTTFVVSNTAGFYSTLVNTLDDATLTGAYSFTGQTTFTTAVRPVLTADTDTAINAALITYGQLARTVIAGGTNASTTLQGLVQLATQAQYDAKTLTGSTGAKLVATPDLNRATKYNDYVADTGAVNAYVIAPSPAITAYTTGQEFTVKIANTNTSTSATLNVNALGTKTILNSDGSVPTIGQLVAGGIYKFIYDGTNMQIGAPYIKKYSNSIGTFQAASATQTITHNLGAIPKRILITAYCGVGASASMLVGSSTGSWDGSGQSYSAITIVSGGNNSVTQSTGAAVNAYGFNGTTVSNYVGTIQNVTATQFDIAWVSTNAGAQVDYVWTAEN